MKTIYRTTLLLLLCVGALSAQTADADGIVFDSLLSHAHAAGVFSGSVLVARNGSVIYTGAVGYATIADSLKNTPETTYMIGSITKLFTKAVILQLAAEGRLKLTDKIGKYVKGFARGVGDVITLQQLMDHSSGFGDYSRDPAWGQKTPGIISVSDVLPLIRSRKPAFKPGTQTQYSNSGYVLLAAVIEKVTAQKYSQVVEQRIFQPLKMASTRHSVANIAVAGKATGYMTNLAGPPQPNTSLHVIGAGDGGIYSSVGDMYKFAQWLSSDDKPLNHNDKLRLVNSPFMPEPYTTWSQWQASGRIAIAGGAPGISAVTGLNNGAGYCFVVLSNYDQGSAEEMTGRIVALLNGKEPAKFTQPPGPFILNLIQSRGPEYFVQNYTKELRDAGIRIEDDMILLGVGQKLLEEHQIENAIALYTVYTQQFPDIVVAWNDLGDAYRMKGDTAKARECYGQTLKLRPGNLRAAEELKKLK